MRFNFLLDYTPGTPDNWQELAVYVLTGAVPLLFGLLKRKQNQNTKEIKYLRQSVMMQQLNGGQECPTCGKVESGPTP